MLIRLNTEIKLTNEQKKQLKLELAARLFVRNLYIQEQDKSEDYINNYEFSKWFNNVYIPENPDKAWLKKASSKNIRNVMDVVHQTYQKAFKGDCEFPVKKKRKKYNVGYYFVRHDKQSPIPLERHKMKVPCLGWVTLKEEGYIHGEVTSGTIKQRGDRYFISAVVNVNESYEKLNDGEGLGIDFGVKEFLILSNGIVFSNINKSPLIRKLEKKLKREQRALSRKFEDLKRKPKEECFYKNIEKNKLRIERLYFRLECLRNAYINKCIDFIIELRPSYITVEDLHIKGMLKNKHLSKAIQDSKLSYTKQILIDKARKHGIEIREVSRWYPSSKICSVCGEKKQDLKLSDRVYECKHCGNYIDRDLNAAINLKNAEKYEVLTEENSSNTTDGLSGSNACGVLNQTVIDISSFKKKVEAEHAETRRCHFIFKSQLNTKRNLMYNVIVNEYI